MGVAGMVVGAKRKLTIPPKLGRGLVNIDVARHVTRCHLTLETRVKSGLDDLASNIRQALCGGTASGARCPWGLVDIARHDVAPSFL